MSRPTEATSARGGEISRETYFWVQVDVIEPLRLTLTPRINLGCQLNAEGVHMRNSLSLR
jgi:hypothetical protein